METRATAFWAVAWVGSAVVTPPGAWCRSRRRDPDEDRGATPAEAPRRSRGSECQRVGLWRGSRRRSRRGLPRSMALFVAFPSHFRSRSPIAAASPLDRRWGRSVGGRRANERRALTAWPVVVDSLISQVAPARLHPPIPSFFLLHGKMAFPSPGVHFRVEFFQKQAGVSPLPLCFTDSICRYICRRWRGYRFLASPSYPLVVDRQKTSGKCR
jgi:hypothetical protein